MFELNVLDVSSGIKQLPPKPYLAVGIAADSTLDMVKVDGRVVGPGGPLLLSGSVRSLSVEKIRGSTATVTLIAVTKTCGLGSIPPARNLQRVETSLIWTSGVGAGAVNVDIPGRRHTTVGIYTGAAGTVLDVTGRRYSRTAGASDLTRPIVTARAVGTAIDSFEIGGTDHEECWDRLEFAITTTGVAVTAGLLVVESYGELGR